MKPRLALLLGALLLLTSLSAAHALTTIPRDFEALVTRADTVFKGTVTASASRWVGEGTTRHIVTLVTFQVQETYKGEAAPTQTLRFLGGTVGDDTLEVPDLPRFALGQTAILFVVGNGQQFCPLVGVAQGRFHVVRDAASGEERILTDDRSPVVSTRELGQFDADGAPRLRRYVGTGTPALSAAAFRAEILARVAALGR